MIKVLHWINLTRLFRCHLTFENNEQFTHYYITDLARHNLKNKDNVYTGAVRNPSFLKKICGQIKPDVIICSNLINADLMLLMKKQCKLFIYISHTIWSDAVIQKKLQGHEQPLQSYSVFDKMYFLEKEIAMWKKLKMPEDKLVQISGLTYMDPILMMNHDEVKKNMLNIFFKNVPEQERPNKFMLLIHNSSSGCIFPNGAQKYQKVNSDDYGLMLQEMVEYSKKNNCHVFAKIGRRSNTLTETALIRKLHDSKYVTVIRPEKDYMLYDFLFCDAIINQSYSAAYQESLLANHCVACCYLNGLELIDSSKYPDLPVIRKVDEIQPLLNKMINHREHFWTDKINKQIDSLVIDTFGNKLENVTERLLNDIPRFLKIEKSI